ncbi:MAG: rhomboid family intramembrane serine protease [Myxococcales bacterium]|nr:rhomboid family intramembrane serine protease [Myxococcales bacterium]
MSVPSQSFGNELNVGPVFGIPVRFSPWFLLLVLMVAWSTRSVQAGVVVLVCFTVSVLAHELGHGLMAKSYGLRPAIVIHGFGGWCERAAISDRRKNLRIVAAGPGVSLGLALSFWVFDQILPPAAPSLVRLTVGYMAYANLFWGLFNLLPIVPMDGGRILQLQLGYHMSQNRADGVTAWVGTGFAVLGVMYAWSSQSLPMLLFMVYLGWQNGQQLAYHPFARTFQVRGRLSPASTGTSGFELPPVLAAFAGAIVGAFVAVTASAGASGFGQVVLFPARVLAGASPWSLLTAPIVHGPWDWAPLLYALVALWAFGPTVSRAYADDRKLVLLYVGSLWLGSLTALFLAGPLGVPMLPVYGAGAGSTALLVAWARFAKAEPVFPGLPILPRQLAVFVVLGEAALALTHLVTWGWHAHVAGVVLALIIPPRKLADNVVELFPQGKQDVWH